MRLPLHPLWRDDQRLVGVVIFVHDQMRDIGQPQAGAHQKLIHVSEGVAELVSRLPDGSQLCAAEHAGPNARLSWRRHSLCRVVIEYTAVVGPLVELPIGRATWRESVCQYV